VDVCKPRLQYTIGTYQQGSERLEMTSNQIWEFLGDGLGRAGAYFEGREYTRYDGGYQASITGIVETFSCLRLVIMLPQ
jgi:hypothetical protein